MDNKFYVSLETARLLKEKGYDERRDYVYAPDGRIISLKMLSNWSDDYLSAPTKAEAIDWLESKGIVVEVNMNYCGLNNWHYILHRENILKAMYSEDDDIYFSTRLEAEDAAIIKACELL